MSTDLLQLTEQAVRCVGVVANARRRAGRYRRNGISTLWMIATIPIILTLLCAVVHFGNQWLARVELEDALEAAALAAVKEWGDAGGGPTQAPREVGVAYAHANTVRLCPVEIATNLDFNPSPDNPNENLTCCVGKADPTNGIPPSGNLIFGAITDDDPLHPITFNAGIPGGCLPATVLIDITKPDAGSPGANSETNERVIGIFYDEGPPSLSIRSVSFTMPFLGNNLSQQPYFDADKVIAVSDSISVSADELNRFNPDPPPKDVRGLDPDPVTAPDNWLCPGPPLGGNPNGDICFTLSDQVVCQPCGDNRFRTLTIHFSDGAFTSTNDPDTTDFVRFGASLNQLNPPALPPGTKNDGEAFHKAPVSATVVFYDGATGNTRTATAVFIDDEDPNNGRAIALLGGGGGQGLPAVRAQAVVPVRGLCARLFGFKRDPLYVSACATAMYDCETRRPRLIRVDRFICPGPTP